MVEQPIKRGAAKPKGKTWWQIALITLAIVIGIISVSFAIYETGRKLGFHGESDAVRYLKSDPLASLELPGLELEHAEQSKDQHLIMNDAAHVNRWFKTANGQSYEQAFADLIHYAKQNDWIESGYEGIDPEKQWRGNKKSPKDSRGMELIIDIIEPYDEHFGYESSSELIWVTLY